MTIQLDEPAALHHVPHRHPDHRRLQPAGVVRRTPPSSAPTPSRASRSGATATAPRRSGSSSPAPATPSAACSSTTSTGASCSTAPTPTTTASSATGSASHAPAATPPSGNFAVVRQHGRQRQPHRHARPSPTATSSATTPTPSRTTARAPTATSSRTTCCASRPTGARAPCATGIDHNFGPKNDLIGGDGQYERNVIGPTYAPGHRVLARLGPGPAATRGHHHDLPDQRQQRHRQLGRLPDGRQLRPQLPLRPQLLVRPTTARASTSTTARSTTTSCATTSPRPTTASRSWRPTRPATSSGATSSAWRPTVTRAADRLGHQDPLGGHARDHLRQHHPQRGAGRHRAGPEHGLQRAHQPQHRHRHQRPGHLPGAHRRAARTKGANTLLRRRRSSRRDHRRRSAARASRAPRSRSTGRAGRPASRACPSSSWAMPRSSSDGTWKLDHLGRRRRRPGHRAPDPDRRQHLRAWHQRGRRRRPPSRRSRAMSSSRTTSDAPSAAAGATSTRVAPGPSRAPPRTSPSMAPPGRVSRCRRRHPRGPRGRRRRRRTWTVTGTVTFDRVPVGTSAYAYVLARANGTNAYRAAIRVATGGLVYVQLKKALSNVESNIGSEVAVPGLSSRPAAPSGSGYELVGTDLSLRVWDATGSEPADLDGDRLGQHGRAPGCRQRRAADLLRQLRLATDR